MSGVGATGVLAQAAIPAASNTVDQTLVLAITLVRSEKTAGAERAIVMDDKRILRGCSKRVSHGVCDIISYIRMSLLSGGPLPERCAPGSSESPSASKHHSFAELIRFAVAPTRPAGPDHLLKRDCFRNTDALRYVFLIIDADVGLIPNAVALSQDATGEVSATFGLRILTRILFRCDSWTCSVDAYNEYNILVVPFCSGYADDRHGSAGSRGAGL